MPRSPRARAYQATRDVIAEGQCRAYHEAIAALDDLAMSAAQLAEVKAALASIEKMRWALDAMRSQVAALLVLQTSDPTHCPNCEQVRTQRSQAPYLSCWNDGCHTHRLLMATMEAE